MQQQIYARDQHRETRNQKRHRKKVSPRKIHRQGNRVLWSLHHELCQAISYEYDEEEDKTAISEYGQNLLYREGKFLKQGCHPNMPSLYQRIGCSKVNRPNKAVCRKFLHPNQRFAESVSGYVERRATQPRSMGAASCVRVNSSTAC